MAPYPAIGLLILTLAVIWLIACASIHATHSYSRYHLTRCHYLLLICIFLLSIPLLYSARICAIFLWYLLTRP